MARIDVNVNQMNSLSELIERNKEILFTKTILFKELTEKDELMQMFALRYLVYRYVNFIKPNRNELDIDCYDRYATYLGAFEMTRKTKRLIGSVRIINGDHESHNTKIINEIVNNLEDYKSFDFLRRHALFPIMETFDLPEEYLVPFSDNQNNGKPPIYHRPYEISRLAVLPEYWGTREKIEKGIRDLVIFYSWKSEPKKHIYVIATHPKTRKRYERLGFRIIPGCTERLYHGINRPAIAMAIDMKLYFNDLKEYDNDIRYNSLFRYYLNSGQFVQNYV